MGKFLIGLIVGLVVGIGGVLLAAGGMLGLGVATGLPTGICMTAEAARQLNLMTVEQVDQVLRRAAENMPRDIEGAKDADTLGSAAQCEEILRKLRAASKSKT